MDLKDLPIRIIELFQSLGTLQAYSLILGVLFLCGLGLPVPEDITLISAGILSATGTISVTGAILAGFLGVLVGDAILFFLGRHFGPSVYSWPAMKRVFTPERILAAEAKVRRNGKFICFVARFMPGLRAPIYLTAGILGVRPVVFLTADGLAALISVPVWIFLGNWFGTNIDQLLKMAKKINSALLVGVVVVIVALLIARKLRKRHA